MIETRQVNIGAEVSGRLIDVRVDEGAKINAGDIVATVDHSSLDIQLRQARAGVELAKAQLDLIARGARSEDIKQAEEQLNQVESMFKVAEEDFRRLTSLFQSGSATARQKDEAESRYQVLLSQRNAAREALNKIKRLARPEEIKAAEARLAQSQATVELLEKTIADSSIKSPLSGLVTSRVKEKGEFVLPGTTVITISLLDPVFLKLYIPEKEVGQINLGQEVEVFIDAFPERPFSGRIIFISPEAEFTPRNIQTKDDRVKLVFAVKVEIPNPEGWLKPGLPADAVISIGQKRKNPEAP